MFETRKGLWRKEESFKISKIITVIKVRGGKTIEQEELNGMRVGRQNGEWNVRRDS